MSLTVNEAWPGIEMDMLTSDDEFGLAEALGAGRLLLYLHVVSRLGYIFLRGRMSLDERLGCLEVMKMSLFTFVG